MTVIRRTLAACALSAAALTATAGGASAAVTITVPTGLCAQHTFSTPFAALGDTAAYTRVPGGDFEGALTSWAFTGKATTVVDRVDNLGSGTDARALSLAPGATATSPLMCVTTDYPYLRFFARSKSASFLSLLTVEVLYEATTPATVIPVAVLSGAQMAKWQATPQLHTAVLLATVAANLAKTQQILAGTQPIVGAGPMRVRLTAVSETWEVDDLFVDPRMR